MGIDPGYDRLGVAVISRENNIDTYIYSVCIQSNNKESFINRLLYINNELEIIISEYKPDLIVIESLFFAKNAKTAMQVAEARGSLLLTSSKYFYNKRENTNTTLIKKLENKKVILNLSKEKKQIKTEILELTPMQIKSSLAGDGHADKEKVSYMVYQILNLNKIEGWKNNKHIDDEIDALSIALAGAQYNK